MTAATSVSPNINGAQPSSQDASNNASSAAVDSVVTGVPMQQLPPQHLHPQLQHHHQHQSPTVQYTPQYPIMPTHMVYQGYPGTTHHPGTYMAAAPHFPPAPPGAYTMYPASDSQSGSGGPIGPIIGHSPLPHSGSSNKQLRGSSPNYHGHNSINSNTSASGSNPGTITAVGPSPNMDPNLKTTLWMGIDNWMDENYIRSLWMNAAGVEVTVKMIRDRYTGNPANYCFVDFPSYEQAMQCVKLDNTPVHTLPETVWRLNWASGGGIHDTKAPEYSIFVGDLGADVTDDILLASFTSRYPSTKTAKVVMDPATGNSRGFGFVRFTSEDDQQRSLIEMNGVPIGQRAIRVGNATPKHRHGPSAHSHTSHHHPGGTQRTFHHNHNQLGNPYGPGSMGNLPSMYPGSANIQAVVAAAAASDPSNTTVFIGGLSHPVSEDEIRSLFASQGEITLVKIPPGKNCAFVSYARRDSAEKAITELNGFTLGNNKVRLSWGRPNHNSNQTGHSLNPHGQHAHHHQQLGGPAYLQPGGTRHHHLHPGGPGPLPSAGAPGITHPGAPGGLAGVGHYSHGHGHGPSHGPSHGPVHGPGHGHGHVPPSGFPTGGNGSNSTSFPTSQAGNTPYGTGPPNAFAAASAANQGLYPLPLPTGDNNSLPYGYVGNVSGPTGPGAYPIYSTSGNPGPPIPSSGAPEVVANGEVAH